MKPIKNSSFNKVSVNTTSQTTHGKNVVRLHVVSEQERDLYRIPSYGYLVQGRRVPKSLKGHNERYKSLLSEWFAIAGAKCR